MSATRERVDEALAWLERRARKRFREDMLTRYGITAKKAWGVPMSAIQQLGKQLGKDHELALALWETGWYEARTLAAFVEEPAQRGVHQARGLCAPRGTLPARRTSE